MNFHRILALMLVIPALAAGQEITFRGRVNVIHVSNERAGNGNVVVWLTPTSPQDIHMTSSSARLIQKDKRFLPHVIAVRVGTDVEFPNQDPFFHDVFSIYHGKPFDLGLYESGTSRKVRFSGPGVSYIFCNIHPEMSAAVIAVPTPYFAITSNDGSFEIRHVPRGRYRMAFWYELSSPAELESLKRDVEIDGDAAEVNVDVHSSDIPTAHLNKYGQQYPAEKRKSY
jgi:plastocyanin